MISTNARPTARKRTRRKTKWNMSTANVRRNSRKCFNKRLYNLLHRVKVLKIATKTQTARTISRNLEPEKLNRRIQEKIDR